MSGKRLAALILTANLQPELNRVTELDYNEPALVQELELTAMQQRRILDKWPSGPSLFMCREVTTLPGAIYYISGLWCLVIFRLLDFLKLCSSIDSRYQISTHACRALAFWVDGNTGIRVQASPIPSDLIV